MLNIKYNYTVKYKNRIIMQDVKDFSGSRSLEAVWLNYIQLCIVRINIWGTLYLLSYFICHGIKLDYLKKCIRSSFC